MKKGVVLLLTLFFITTISVLVLKNLDDTDDFIEKQSYILNNTQVLISIKNVQEEVSKLLIKHKDTVDDALENDVLQEQIPIKIDDLDIKFKVNNYSKVDINEMNKKDSNTIENLFNSNDVFDYSLFKEIYKEKLNNVIKKVETSKQLDDIINAFIIRTYNDDILKIKDELGFVKAEGLYELNIDVKFYKSYAKAYYLLEKNGKVRYFDISFK